MAEHGEDSAARTCESSGPGSHARRSACVDSVGNLAAAARLDRPGVEVSTRRVAAADLVERAAAEFAADRDGCASGDVRASATGRCGPTRSSATRALVSLVENALDLSPAGEPVEITVARTTIEVSIEVADRGPGVPEELRERIFDAFTQADGSATRSHEGLGIGLFLTRRIMAAHGGGITYRERPGGGSVFCLAFPLRLRRRGHPVTQSARGLGASRRARGGAGGGRGAPRDRVPDARRTDAGGHLHPVGRRRPRGRST